MAEPSKMDQEFMEVARDARDYFLYRMLPDAGTILEIGPRIPMAGTSTYHTLDILPGCTFQADICTRTGLSESYYDVVIAMEVLEHVFYPFAALSEIRRVMKPGGLLIASSPFNARIHGPLPDLYRFTVHGWRLMLKDWDEVEIVPLETPDRFLMPIQYCVSARCNKEKNVDPSTLTWEFIR